MNNNFKKYIFKAPKTEKYDRDFIPQLEIFQENSKKIKESLIEGLQDVNFNVLDLNFEELHFTVWKLFDYLHFYEKYKVDIKIWQEFVWVLERKYNSRSNPFHNFYHAITGFSKLKNLNLNAN